MKQVMIVNRQQPRLVLFFAGWGMDETPFLHYCPQQSDLMVCYDYRELSFDDTLLKNYREIHLVAWSMGVWAASKVLSWYQELPITRSIAINGTPYPVDEERGISPAIFNGTLEGLNAASLLKFQRRMCANGDAFARFQAMAPRRPLEELKEELTVIGTLCTLLPPSDWKWNRAFIGDNDRIFPPQAQQKAWKGICRAIEHGSEAHYDNELLQRLLV